jgi:hypothetical protein
MKSATSTKLAALVVAMSINGLIVGSVAYLFNGQIHTPTPTVALAQVTQSVIVAARI